MRPHAIGPNHPNFAAINHRILVTWLKTLTGTAVMFGLVFLAFYEFGSAKLVHELTHSWFTYLWLVFPVISWWYSAKLSLVMAKAVPANSSVPEEKRLIDLVNAVWLESGLKYKPPVFIAQSPMPNAFATGPIHRKAVVAATRGLFEIGLTDDEIKAVFSHELSHVRNYDVAINSFQAILSSMLFLVLNFAFQAIFGGMKLLSFIFGKNGGGFIRRMLSDLESGILFYGVFWLVSQVTIIIQMFVTRSRESAADAYGSRMTGNPCALATALEKLSDYVEKHRPTGKEKAFWLALRPATIVDPIYDVYPNFNKPKVDKHKSLWQWVKYYWVELHLTHPDTAERIEVLEQMNGGSCPRI